MRVLLRSDVAALGKRGDVVEVADGYARNYLFPGRHAIAATNGTAAQAASMRRSRDLRDAKDREGAEAIARVLVPTVITILARAGSGGRLFGSVTSQDVVTAVREQTGIELDRRRLAADEPIRSLGVHELGVRLHPEVELRLTVEVKAET
ncbi:MAG: 50S ribosomal protein L9 [Acidimicrobiales bacterium]